MNTEKPRKRKLIRVGEAAEILGVSVSTLIAWDKKGTLKAIRFGTRRDRRYDKSELIRISKQGA